ncbi:MAG: beta-ketoacyl-ACP synthase [Myxococcales bacterium]|nr:beta-ketoacyl-ACP synthase [Myxococcales bacterium]
MQPAVITAMSLCNGMGARTAEVLASLRAGRSGLAACPDWLGLAWPATVGALPERLPELPARLADYDTRQTRIAALALDELMPAIVKARARWGRDRVAVILGTSTGGIGASELAYAHHAAHGSLPAGFTAERSHALDAVVPVVAALAEVTGPGYVLSTACSSSARVFAAAQRLLMLGVCDAAIVGGVDSLCQLTVRGFASLEVLAPGPCRPFSRERAGINIGEGAALCLLERTGEGPARLLAVGESSDAHHMTSPHPEGLGARLAMERALAQAGLLPGAVDHVNAHGTGTRQNDAAEGAAIAALFGPGMTVAATKGYTGHMLGAAGATEVGFAIAAIEEGVAPASAGSAPLDEEIPVRVTTAAAPMRTRVVLSNSFAFGGSNVSVLVGVA